MKLEKTVRGYDSKTWEERPKVEVEGGVLVGKFGSLEAAQLVAARCERIKENSRTSLEENGEGLVEKHRDRDPDRSGPSRRRYTAVVERD